MVEKHVTIDALRGKVIDCHSHVGLSLKNYACREYPYAQTIEGLYYRQRAGGVDVNIVFPASGSLFFDPACFAKGEMRPAKNPLSPTPYTIENEMMMLEVFEFNPEHQERFLPFVMVDPGRDIAGQLQRLGELEKRFAVYGVKIAPVDCQSKITSLLDEGRPLVDYAAQRDLPLLLHTTADPLEQYSHAADCFRVIDQNPHLRFCLAHCIGFHAEYLERADEMPNVWVDSSALKIQAQCALENNRIIAAEVDRFEGDYSDHTKILGALAARYPDTIMWGTDSPWYTFICHRKQGEGTHLEFRLKAHYEDEIAALDSLPAGARRRACNTNVLKFLFGT